MLGLRQIELAQRRSDKEVPEDRLANIRGIKQSAQATIPESKANDTSDSRFIFADQLVGCSPLTRANARYQLLKCRFLVHFVVSSENQLSEGNHLTK